MIFCKSRKKEIRSLAIKFSNKSIVVKSSLSHSPETTMINIFFISFIVREKVMRLIKLSRHIKQNQNQSITKKNIKYIQIISLGKYIFCFLLFTRTSSSLNQYYVIFPIIYLSINSLLLNISKFLIC